MDAEDEEVDRHHDDLALDGGGDGDAEVGEDEDSEEGVDEEDHAEVTGVIRTHHHRSTRTLRTEERMVKITPGSRA